MRKIITIVGARPQFIKAATVSRQFSLCDVEELIIHTGQHFDTNMSEVFFEEMEISAPAYQLNIHGLSHAVMTARMLEGIEKILLKEKPDGVLVYGDTNSTLAGGLAAAKLTIPLIHVEAGLRSYNRNMPEEINRIVTDKISNVLFCPTSAAMENLRREGLENSAVHIIKNGDVMQDAAIYYAAKAEQKSSIISDLGLNKFILTTIHRQENTDNENKLREIVNGLNDLNNLIQVIVPLHPRTRKLLNQYSIKAEFKVIEPVGYFDMIMLIRNSQLVVTDSGGIQKEAFFFGKHCITLRKETEWVELVENGFNILVGSNREKLLEAYSRLINRKSDFSINLYGNGDAAAIAALYIRNL